MQLLFPKKKAAPVAEKKLIEKKYSGLSKAEKKEFRKELKAEIKKAIKNKKAGDSVNDTKALDYNLKWLSFSGPLP
jgi:TPP-dependent pyruvate/acetoin dehydrogenase alpha subunit